VNAGKKRIEVATPWAVRFYTEFLCGSTQVDMLFLTAFDEYVMQAFEVHAIAYLLKPIDSSRFEAALQHARRVLGGIQAASYQDRPRVFSKEMRAFLCQRR
jgi:DNA-binding LytR/AlgR family response regulator